MTVNLTGNFLTSIATESYRGELFFQFVVFLSCFFVHVMDAVVSAMNSAYRRNHLPLEAFIHCMAETHLHDLDLTSKDNMMEVFASSDSLGRKKKVKNK